MKLFENNKKLWNGKKGMVGTCFDFFLKKITPNLLKFYFYSLKQWWFSSVNQDNMAIESCVIGHVTY